MASSPFRFKKFEVAQHGAAHPVGTDSVLLGAWADVSGARTVLDIGTGTGVVALMVAQRAQGNVQCPTRNVQCPSRALLLGDQQYLKPESHLDIGHFLLDIGHFIALEIHPPSAALARRNFAASPWAERLQVLEMSVQDFAQSADNQFDLIVSNPPFFSERTVSPDPTRRLGRHTATLPPDDLLEAVARLLAPKGKFCVVLPALEGQRLCEMAVPLGLYWTKITQVRSRPEKPVERWLIQFERDPYPFERAELLIYEQGERYSAAFRELTGEFYLHEAGRGGG